MLEPSPYAAAPPGSNIAAVEWQQTPPSVQALIHSLMAAGRSAGSASPPGRADVPSAALDGLALSAQAQSDWDRSPPESWGPPRPPRASSAAVVPDSAPDHHAACVSVWVSPVGQAPAVFYASRDCTPSDPDGRHAWGVAARPLSQLPTVEQGVASPGACRWLWSALDGPCGRNRRHPWHGSPDPPNLLCLRPAPPRQPGGDPADDCTGNAGDYTA